MDLGYFADWRGCAIVWTYLCGDRIHAVLEDQGQCLPLQKGGTQCYNGRKVVNSLRSKTLLVV